MKGSIILRSLAWGSCFVLFGAAAWGQVYVGYGRAYGYGWGWGGGTVASNYAYGMSSVIRAQADANYVNTQALLQAEQVKRARLENQRLATQTYYDLRRMNEENRAAEEERRKARLASQPTKATPPLSSKRLPATQLDPVTGKIAWPAILMTDNLRAYRAQVDALFTQRAHEGRPVSLTELKQAADPLRHQLDTSLQQNAIAAQDWLSGKRLLDGLELETRFPGG